MTKQGEEKIVDEKFDKLADAVLEVKQITKAQEREAYRKGLKDGYISCWKHIADTSSLPDPDTIKVEDLSEYDPDMI